MSVFDAIRSFLLRRKINAHPFRLQRVKRVSNINQAATVGILYSFRDRDEFELIRKYVSYLREMKKKVKCLVYYDTKEEPNVSYSKIDFDFVGKKSHAPTGVPTDHLITNFIEEEFDILIDVNFTSALVLTYTTAISRAHFKVGRTDQYQDDYDLLLATTKDKGVKAFLRETDTYLQMINKS